MNSDSLEVWLQVVGVILTIALIVGGFWLKYHYCIEAGFSEEECTYLTYCAG